jgi:plastocyanin
MKQLVTLLFCVPFLAQAQVNHNVQVGGSTVGGTPPFYSPQNLTISVGDIVRWTNTSGTHNVNGSTTLFPANPQGFSSGSPQGGSWTFEFTFTIAGVYNYHCTQQGHSATQFGSITVLNPTVVEENTQADDILLFPVPANDQLNVLFGTQRVDRAELIALDGRTMLTVNTSGTDRTVLATSALSAGHYMLRLYTAEGAVISRSFYKD